MKTYEIYEIDGIIKDGELCGGDSNLCCKPITKREAFRLAKRQSKFARVYEMTVYEYEGKEITGHWYFQKGVQTWSMFGN